MAQASLYITVHQGQDQAAGDDRCDLARDIDADRVHEQEILVVLGQTHLVDNTAAHREGGDARRAELAALYDALWQRDGYAEPLDRELLPALEAERARRVREDAAAVEPTRVDFFTLVRGED